MAELVLASCTDDQGMLATDLRSGAVVASFDECAAQPNAFGAIGACSGYVYAVQTKKALWNVWSWNDKKPFYRASLPEKMTAMAFTTDGALCFGGSATGSIWIWQTSTGTLLKSWPAHFREVTQLKVSDDAAFLVSASADSNVHVFNLADVFEEQAPRPFHSWAGHSLSVSALALLPGRGAGRTVVSGSLDRSVRLWDVGTGRQISSRTLSAPVHSLCTGPSGAEILCALGCGDLISFSPATSATEGDGTFVGHTGPVLSCDLNIDASQAASCSAADRVRIWEMRTPPMCLQVHSSRNVQINAVQIMQRAAFSSGLPPFQPFQRILTRPEDIPPVPICVAGRAEALDQALEEHEGIEEFYDNVIWHASASSGSMDDVDELKRELAEARAGQAHWAEAAADLYAILVEEGLDMRAPPAPAGAPAEESTELAPTAGEPGAAAPAAEEPDAQASAGAAAPGAGFGPAAASPVGAAVDGAAEAAPVDASDEAPAPEARKKRRQALDGAANAASSDAAAGAAVADG
eukprot:CAMPEP_0168362244 /NCGR_PEP_ID=MMETSP0228-20121227/3079_1 /TAXON_ID=133427 /ORGANISM="Protoceratium reticulatum, Strain CCCM 535 (=CCMP 1889)" /LENGTH=520 /DNA_ID=CAMNT_0008374941 /DNA_START=84 /DNA_END=1644 /DNA_ORIENTATION=-